MKEIYILNTQLSNTQSINFALQKLGYSTKTILSEKELNENDFVVIPGVGNFKQAMLNISKTTNKQKMIDKNIKIFGICLGMQLLLSNSDEGNVEGLNLIEGDVKSLKSKGVVNVPNIGWRKVNFEIDSLSEFNNEYFYFVHSYAVSPKAKNNIAAKINLENQEIPVSITNKTNQVGNYFGCQFHPEKSGDIGLAFLDKIISIMNKND